MKAGILAAIALAVPFQAQAAVALWRTLEAGDSIEVTKAKLEAMPEVKRVKIIKKRGVQQLEINMTDEAVPIFGGHFSVDTVFKDSGLSMVRLTSGAGCLNDGYPLAKKINDELARKYPQIEAPLVDESGYMLRALDATATRYTTTSAGYLGEGVGAMFVSTFIQMAPPSYYGGSAVNRSLYQIARSAYDLKAQHCGGAYYRTAQFSITYLPRTDWEGLRKEVEADNAAERQRASDNL